MATFTRVQTAQNNQGAGASITTSFTSGVTTGNLLVACLASDGQGQTWTAPTGWTQDVNFNDASNGHQVGIFHIVVSSGLAGTTGFTFSTSVSGNATFVTLVEWNSSTGWQASPFDKSATHSNASSTTISCGTTTTIAQASELAVACSSYYNAPAVTQSGYTSGWTAGIQQVQNPGIVVNETYGVYTSATTVTLSYTLASAHAGSGCIATFMPTTSSTVSSGVVDVGSVASGLQVTATVIKPSGVVDIGAVVSGLQITATTVLISGVVDIGASASGLQIIAVNIATGVVDIGSAASGLDILTASGETSLLYDDVQTYYAAIRAIPTLLAQIQFMAKVYFPPAKILDESSVPGEIDILLNGETWANLHELKTINDVNTFIATYS
jgi:hypothetical protein